jgi:PD-(D/E)XK nuclease superfamily protein
MATTKHTGDVGEHWVLYRLIRAGYTAVLAPTNAKAVDILAADRDGKPFSIQVKTKRGAARGWRLTKDAESNERP